MPIGDIARFIQDGKRASRLTRALLLVLYDTINFIFSDFDCQLSAYLRHTEFVLAVAEFYFPSPTAIGQLNNGVSTPLRSIGSSVQHKSDDPGIGNKVGAVSSLVHLMKINFP